VVEDLGLRQHSPRVHHQVAEQVELGGGEGDVLAGSPHLVAVLVQLEVRDGQPHRPVFGAAAGAAQHGPDAGDDLFQAEGLGDVVVAAERQPGDLVVVGVAGGEEQHRHRVPGRAQSAQHHETVDVGQHDVEQHQVGVVALGGLDGLVAGGGGHDLEAREAQAGGQQLDDVGLVVDHEQPRLGRAPTGGGEHLVHGGGRHEQSMVGHDGIAAHGNRVRRAPGGFLDAA
jgi:hypothetical protein